MVVDSRTEQTDYTISMSADSARNTECAFDVNDVRKMLKGSGQVWRNTCKRAVNNMLVIEPAVVCDEPNKVWKVQYLHLKLKFVRTVQVLVDGETIFSVSRRISTAAIISLYRYTHSSIAF